MLPVPERKGPQEVCFYNCLSSLKSIHKTLFAHGI